MNAYVGRTCVTQTISWAAESTPSHDGAHEVWHEAARKPKENCCACSTHGGDTEAVAGYKELQRASTHSCCLRLICNYVSRIVVDCAAAAGGRGAEFLHALSLVEVLFTQRGQLAMTAQLCLVQVLSRRSGAVLLQHSGWVVLLRCKGFHLASRGYPPRC